MFGLCNGYVPAAYEVPHAGDYLNPTAHELLREQLLLQHAARIATETKGAEATTKGTRGTPQRVVCLTDVDPLTGRLRRFRTASAAAAWVGRVCDNVVQAAKRGGRSGGHRWAYELKMPAGFDEVAEVRGLLALKAAA